MTQPLSDAQGRAAKPDLYETLKHAIISGEMSPGQPLLETSLAGTHGVSRTPIREALTRLEQDGLVARAARGLVVRERSSEEILDIYEVRIVLEGTAASMAAQRRTRMDVIKLQRLAERFAQVSRDDREAMITENRDFHDAVWRAGHNEPLVDLLSRLNLHLARYSGTTLLEPGRAEEAAEEHKELVDAIERQDGEAAADVATRHFSVARDLRLAIWARSPM